MRSQEVASSSNRDLPTRHSAEPRITVLMESGPGNSRTWYWVRPRPQRIALRDPSCEAGGFTATVTQLPISRRFPNNQDLDRRRIDEHSREGRLQFDM